LVGDAIEVRLMDTQSKNVALSSEDAEERQRVILRVAERELARGPESAAETRRWLKAVAVSFGFDAATVESLILIASELLANAFLHATGPFSVSLEVERDLLRIGVSDRSRNVPVMKAFDEFAATGRGLRIVAATSSAWGVDLRANGKTVWADLTLPHLEDLADAALQPGDRAGWSEARWRHRAQPGGGPSRTSSNRVALQQAERTAARTGSEAAREDSAKVCRVVYRDVPIDEFIAMRARIEAMLRESTLIVLGGAREDVPAELLELAERATTQFLTVARAEASACPEPIERQGNGLGDFVVDFPVAALDQLEPFADVVETLNTWCRTDHLLVSPLTPEMQRLHRWSIGESARQIRKRTRPKPFVET
jgi:anti-sigma regulatory factor (Ser/Thr protein kinase)